MSQVVEALLLPSITLDDAELFVEGLGNGRIIQAAEEENTNRAMIWVKTESDNKEYIHAFRASGLFQRSEYSNDPTEMDPNGCGCSGSQ